MSIEIDAGEEHRVQFFEPGKDATEAFEAAKQALNFVPSFIHFPIIFPWLTAIAFGRYHGNETQVERELRKSALQKSMCQAKGCLTPALGPKRELRANAG